MSADMEATLRRLLKEAPGSLVGGVQNRVELHVHLTNDSPLIDALVSAVANGRITLDVSGVRVERAQIRAERVDAEVVRGVLTGGAT